MRQIDAATYVTATHGKTPGGLYGCLLSLTDAKTNRVTISQLALAARLGGKGFCERTVRAGLALLEAVGLIIRRPNYDKSTGWRTADTIEVILPKQAKQIAARLTAAAIRQAMLLKKIAKGMKRKALPPTGNGLPRSITKPFNSDLFAAHRGATTSRDSLSLFYERQDAAKKKPGG